MKNIKYNSAFAVLLIVFISIFSINSTSVKAQDVLTENDYFLEGVQCYINMDFDKAEKLLTKAIQINKNNDAAYYYLGLTYFEVKDFDKAEINFKTAQESDPSNFWYRMRLAQFYYESNRTEVALSLYESIINDYPAKSSLYYLIIDLYADNNQIDQAIKTLDKIESLRGSNEATGFARYELLNMQKKYDEAFTFLEEFYKSYPSPRAAFILGDIYKSRYIDSTAIDYYEKAILMDPSYGPAFFGLAETYRMTRQLSLFFPNIYKFFSSPDISLQYKINYLKEVVLNPQFVSTFNSQVDTMVTCIVNTHPSDSAALFMAGNYYIQTQRPEEGKEMYRECLHNYPEDMRANIEYISLLYYMEDWDALIDQTKASLNVFKGDASLMEILAIAYWKKERYTDAIGEYQDMITIEKIKSQINPQYKNNQIIGGYYAAIGDLYHELNQANKSYSYYDKSLKYNPDYNPALNNYAYYLGLEGKKLKKAAQMSKKTVKTEPDNPTYLDTYAWILYLMGDSEEAKGYLKHAMLYGGKESAVILDHYADVLFSLKEYDLAFIYWEQADKMDTSLSISEKIKAKKLEIKK